MIPLSKRIVEQWLWHVEECMSCKVHVKESELVPILFSFVLVVTRGLDMSTPATMESPNPDGNPDNSSGKLPLLNTLRRSHRGVCITTYVYS